jgi:hypothetical protein
MKRFPPDTQRGNPLIKNNTEVPLMADKKWKEVESNVWKPENEGDLIEGVLIQKQPRTDDLSPRYTLDTKDGQFMVWGSAIIADKVEPMNVGCELRITFTGTKDLGKGKKLKQFKVEVAETDEPETESTSASDKPKVEEEAVKN